MYYNIVIWLKYFTQYFKVSVDNIPQQQWLSHSYVTKKNGEDFII